MHEAAISTAEDAAWQWPVSGFTEKIPSASLEQRVEHPGLGRVALGGAGPVGVQVLDVAPVDPGVGERELEAAADLACSSGSIDTTWKPSWVIAPPSTFR